nr:hypothetical protein [Tanacetum cinerariifolium]
MRLSPAATNDATRIPADMPWETSSEEQEKSKMVALAFGEDQGGSSVPRPIGLFFQIGSVGVIISRNVEMLGAVVDIVIESLPLDDDIHVLRREVLMALE